MGFPLSKEIIKQTPQTWINYYQHIVLISNDRSPKMKGPWACLFMAILAILLIFIWNW